MNKRKHVSLLSSPKAWWIEKNKTGFSGIALYFVAVIPGIMAFIGLAADIRTIFTIPVEQIKYYYACIMALFILGVVNVILVYNNNKHRMLLCSHEKNIHIIHKNIIEIFREYRTWSRCGQSSIDIIDYLSKILNEFNTHYMTPNFGSNISASIKYLYKEKLYPIRICENPQSRKMDPEEVSKSFIYNSINEPGKKLSFIYVKDLSKPDDCECSVLGKCDNDIKARALSIYATFIALPIRGGSLRVNSSSFQIRADLGLIGFDMKEPNSFGNIYDHNIDVLGSFADMLSEPIEDLQNVLKDEAILRNAS